MQAQVDIGVSLGHDGDGPPIGGSAGCPHAVAIVVDGFICGNVTPACRHVRGSGPGGRVTTHHFRRSPHILLAEGVVIIVQFDHVVVPVQIKDHGVAATFYQPRTVVVEGLGFEAVKIEEV